MVAVDIWCRISCLDLITRLLKSGYKSSLYAGGNLAGFQLLFDDLELPPIDFDRADAAFDLLEKNGHGYAAIRLSYA